MSDESIEQDAAPRDDQDDPTPSEQAPAGASSEDLAISRQAPGVLGATQAPEGATLKTGEVLGGAFSVERYLGSSPGAVSYYCRDLRKDREVVVKVLNVGQMDTEQVDQFGGIVRKAGNVTQRNVVRVLGFGQTEDGYAFVVMEYVDGPSLSRLLARRREAKEPLGQRDVFTIIAHLCDALADLHPRVSHGVLTPYNMHINRSGTLKIANLVFGSTVAALLSVQGEGPYQDSIYIAPELVHDPTSLTPASDIYSLGMLAVELLSPRGLPSERAAARGAVSGVLSEYPPQLTQLILSMLDTDPTQRPKNLREIRTIFEEVAVARGATLGNPPGPDELPIEPADTLIQPREEDDDDLFDISQMLAGRDDLAISGEMAARSGGFYVQKDGLDYGPYDKNQVLKQLYADEIDEDTFVLDRDTQDRKPLQEHEVFRSAVEAYIPKREERRAREAALRAERIRKAKKGGLTGLIISAVGGVIVLAGMSYYWLTLPKPEPIPADRVFASLDYKLLPPPKEFASVAVDSAMLKNIFDPSASQEEIARRLKKLRKRRRRKSKRKAGAGGSGGGDSNVTEINMGAAGSGTDHILTDDEVFDVIMSKFGTLRGCVVKELNVNSRFKGVTVRFFVRPSGTTGGVKIQERAYRNKPVGHCLVSKFRVMKFPKHGGFNRGVSFPLKVQ